MGYTTDPSFVRVDFFKPSGKWYTTEAVRWIGYYATPLIHDAFAESLRVHLGDRLSEMDAVCLEPYHQNAHPIQLKNGIWSKRVNVDPKEG